MKLVIQPEGSNLCGQACVAMLTGIPLEKSIETFGRRGATTRGEVVAALKGLGVSCGDRLISAKTHPLPPVCIAKLRFDWDKNHTHWTVYNRGIFFDPAIGMLAQYPPGVRITSFLPVHLAEKE